MSVGAGAPGLAPLAALVPWILRNRHRLPGPVNRAIDHVAENPESLLGRVAVRSVGSYGPDDVPAPTDVPDAEVRVYIGPTNYSGQGHEWARALARSSGRVGAVNVAVDVPGGYAFLADTVVPVPVYHRSSAWQRAELDAVSRFTHVLFEAERPLFGRLFGRDVEREVAELRARGLSVAMMAHGTDVRVPSRHARATPFSPFREARIYVDKLERDATRNIAILRRVGAPTFVSTPDLLNDVPWATWCPVVIDVEKWDVPRREQGEGPLRVVHAPTSSTIKGTHLIEPVLDRLHAEGVIDYRRIVGTPHSDMPSLFAEADVVLDQFRLGAYGVAACEAMAAGCIAVGHLLPHVRAHIESVAGGPIPLVEATPETLEGVLRGLAVDAARRRDLAEQSRAYVRKMHDGRESARVLREEWIDLPEDGRAGTPSDEGVLRESVAAGAGLDRPIPTVDMIIAVHSPERPVERAVRSILDATRTPCRVTVVVHNTGVEAIRARLGNLLDDERLRLLELYDRIPSPAGPFNLGIEAATAELFGIMGSDDELQPGAIDAWVALQRATGASVVIARVQAGPDGPTQPAPPVRPIRGLLVDGVRDRLSYRSAPLGLVSRATFGDLRLAVGLRSGEDISYVTSLWFSGAPIAYCAAGPGYVVRDDASDRVTLEPRSVAEDFAFARPLYDGVGRSLTRAKRRSLTVKLIRSNLFDLVANRPEDWWTENERASLAALARELVAFAPSALAPLSRHDRRLLDAIVDPHVPTTAMLHALRARSNYRNVGSLIPRNPLRLLDRESPLRWGLAATLVRRHLSLVRGSSAVTTVRGVLRTLGARRA